MSYNIKQLGEKSVSTNFFIADRTSYSAKITHRKASFLDE